MIKLLHHQNATKLVSMTILITTVTTRVKMCNPVVFIVIVIIVVSAQSARLEHHSLVTTYMVFLQRSADVMSILSFWTWPIHL